MLKSSNFYWHSFDNEPVVFTTKTITRSQSQTWTGDIERHSDVFSFSLKNLIDLVNNYLVLRAKLDFVTPGEVLDTIKGLEIFVVDHWQVAGVSKIRILPF